MRFSRKLLLRFGLIVFVAGASVLMAALASTTVPVTTQVNTPLNAHEEYGAIYYLNVRDYEIRISVPWNFSGSFLVYNYDGIMGFCGGDVDKFQMEFAVQGPSIVDFKPLYRGFYMLMIKSNYDGSVNLGLGIVGKPGVEPDTLRDGGIILSAGLAVSAALALIGFRGKWLQRFERFR